MSQILTLSLLDILHQHSRNVHDAEILYDNLAQYLQPLFIRLSLQSKAEYILLCQRLHVYQLDPFQAISNFQNDTIFMFLQGKLVLDSSEYDDLDAFDCSYKQIKKNKLSFQRQLNIGYIAENKYIQKIFALETSYLLYVTKQSQQLLLLKHEQFIRQKRTFFMSLFQPTSQVDKFQIQQLSDQLILQYFSDKSKIFTIYQPLESMFIVYSGQVELRTKRNLLCTCSTFDTFNEDCNTAIYTAQIKDQAQVFELSKAQYYQLPQKAKEMIEMRAKSKQGLRKTLIDHHIIDLQVPEMIKSMRYERLTPKRKIFQSLTSIVTGRMSPKKLNTDTSITLKIQTEPDVLMLPLQYHRSMTSRKLNKLFNQ